MFKIKNNFTNDIDGYTITDYITHRIILLFLIIVSLTYGYIFLTPFLCGQDIEIIKYSIDKMFTLLSTISNIVMLIIPFYFGKKYVDKYLDKKGEK